MKIVFIIPSANDSHYRNRVVEFMEHKYEVDVYGFERSNQKKAEGLPYEINILGMLTDSSYVGRLKLYLQKFREMRKIYNSRDVVFFLGGLDIAMSFQAVNPEYRYIYEECDLTHTYTRFKCILEAIDKRIIKKSLLTITTSEGFVNYHFGGKKPDNVQLVENKLNPGVRNCKVAVGKKFDKNELSIGFVGGPRFDSVYNFIDIFCRNFPMGTFHIYGGPVPKQFEQLKGYGNCIFHGVFKNPDDLADIYGTIDLVLATYDTRFENVRYAEPNKLYESIYFETPIIVSSGTFLAEKVKRLGIGYDINAMNDKEVVAFVNQLTEDALAVKVDCIRRIDKQFTLNINEHFFTSLKDVLTHPI